MSKEAVKWAAKFQPDQPADKLVLWAIADCHNIGSGIAYPSVAAIMLFGGLSRSSVLRALDRLHEAGLILDTGDRRGRTGQVKVWALPLSQPLPKGKPAPARKGAPDAPLADDDPAADRVF